MNKLSLSSEDKICETILQTLKKYRKDNFKSIDSHERFDQLGLDSLNSLLFISDLEEIFLNEGKVDIDLPTLMQHPTPALLAKHIFKNLN